MAKPKFTVSMAKAPPKQPVAAAAPGAPPAGALGVPGPKPPNPMGGVQKLKVGDPPPGGFELQDNQDGSFDVFGVNAAGNRVDITALATLAVTSDNESVLTVDPPTNMHVVTHGRSPGEAKLTVTASWHDGSIGPFVIEIPANVASSPVQGLAVEFGTPTTR